MAREPLLDFQPAYLGLPRESQAYRAKVDDLTIEIYPTGDVRGRPLGRYDVLFLLDGKNYRRYEPPTPRSVGEAQEVAERYLRHLAWSELCTDDALTKQLALKALRRQRVALPHEAGSRG